jgi:hypothetical protein
VYAFGLASARNTPAEGPVPESVSGVPGALSRSGGGAPLPRQVTTDTYSPAAYWLTFLTGSTGPAALMAACLMAACLKVARRAAA